jgi:hypothetical protein
MAAVAERLLTEAPLRAVSVGDDNRSSCSTGVRAGI